MRLTRLAAGGDWCNQEPLRLKPAVIPNPE
jgi:hypothetical protein